jgi:hypothetical protein
MGVMQHPATIPPAPAVMAILDRFNRDELGHTIEVLIALLDIWDGDPDAETGNDVEDDFMLTANAVERATSDPSVDCVDQDAGAYVEWHTMRGSQKGGPNTLAGHEDDEEDDPAGQCDEDGINTKRSAVLCSGPGCTISDPDKAVDDKRCDDPDQESEREQQLDDVPMLPVYSAAHNVFTDHRASLGISNLTKSFVGQDVRSADTGAMQSSRPDGWPTKSAVPI